MAKLIYADAERCIACRACEVACLRGHDGQSNVAVVRVEGRFAVPLSCRHCDPAPCVAACRAAALVARDGRVVFDAGRCTGCSLCLVACPFGVIGPSMDGRSVHQCDLCADRLTQGQEPLCAVTCPTQALRYEEYAAFIGRVQHRAAVDQLRAAPSQIVR